MSDRLAMPVTPGRTRIRFPPELPISLRVPDIFKALAQHPVVIVSGATGSGKTTQLPKIALELGRGNLRRIGVTQPRRIAATSVAARVARELDSKLGTLVGYKIRFEDRTSRETRIKFMTDGVLLAEIQSDRKLRAYDTLIIDEAHERSLNIDFLLGWLKQLLPSRPDLKVIISSATIETERFSNFFDDAPVIEVEGRTYPVDVLYEPPDPELDLPDAVAVAVQGVTSLDPLGDILVFMPGEREIRETEQALLALKLRHTQVLPLFSRLAARDQARVFESSVARRVILATNVAETSLTIPGIVYVVDTGLARLSRYDPHTGTTRLELEAISQASAEQRKGRCGRVREGICIRLFDEPSFQARPAFTDPEIKRTGLAGVILRMKSLGLGEVADFPLLDPPNARFIAEGYRVLEELGAITDKRELTQVGQKLAQLPVDPRLGRMILAGADLGCLDEVRILVAALNLRDPRERPQGLEQKADQAHRPFRDEQSDFLGLLRLWARVSDTLAQGGLSQLRRFCKDNFLSFVRIREWIELNRQLTEQSAELRLPPGRREARQATSGPCAKTDVLHQALLTGLLSRVGQYAPEQRQYFGARQTRFSIHPSSGLAKKPPQWVMSFELVQTRQLFARMNAKIEPTWLAQVGEHLLKRSYSEPHWSERAGRSQVREHATLFGLPVHRDRVVEHAAIAPHEARLMFITHALVRGEYRTTAAYHEHNRRLFDEVTRLRDKARRSELLADDDHLLAFFERRVPSSVVSGKTFEDWRKQAEQHEPQLLHLTLEDLRLDQQNLDPGQYPDHVDICGTIVPATYTFDPTADDDGITLHVPFALLPQLAAGALDGTIPAWQTEKVAALLSELPRPIAQQLGPVVELADALVTELQRNQGPLLPELSRLVFESTGVHVPLEAFRPHAILPHLRYNIRLLAEDGKVVDESRDIAELVRRHGERAAIYVRSLSVSTDWERRGMSSWDCGKLPPFVERTIAGTVVRSYPTLIDRGTTVDLSLLESEAAAQLAHREGVFRLLRLGARSQLAVLAKRTPGPLSHRPGLPIARSEFDTFRELLLTRVVSEAFALTHSESLPRDPDAFHRMLRSGIPRLTPIFDGLVAALGTISAEHVKTLGVLERASKHPSGAVAVADVCAQLERLLDPRVLANVDLSRLEQFPRYLRAVQTRLDRAVLDPRKDAAKAQPLITLSKAFLDREAKAHNRAAVGDIRWHLEELRVALFAPDLKHPSSVTVAVLTDAIDRLR